MKFIQLTESTLERSMERDGMTNRIKVKIAGCYQNVLVVFLINFACILLSSAGGKRILHTQMSRLKPLLMSPLMLASKNIAQCGWVCCYLLFNVGF